MIHLYDDLDELHAQGFRVVNNATLNLCGTEELRKVRLKLAGMKQDIEYQEYVIDQILKGREEYEAVG